MQASVRDRLLGALGAGIVVALLGWMLVFGLSVEIGARAERLMTLLDLRAPLPRPPRPAPRLHRPTPRKASGRASPRNRRNQATEIVAPPPAAPPIVPPVVAVTTAGAGMASSTGASDRTGPGQGAGGGGAGTGSGGYGDGSGDGDGGDVPPRQIGGRLRYAYLPADLRAAGASGTVEVRYGVETDGRVGDCIVTRSSGSAELDELTCELIRRHFRFAPSRDARGRPVPSQIEERHSWIVDPAAEPPRP